MISKRVQGFTESVIREMTRINNQHNGINLAQGMPNFPPPKEIIEAAHRAIDGDFHQYAITWGTPRLRQAIAETEELYRAWNLLRDAQNECYYIGVRRRSALQPADFQRQIPKLQALAGKVAALAAYATMVTNYFGLPSDPTLAGVKTLIAIFRAEAPRLMTAIDKAAAGTDFEALRRAAHALKGSLGTLDAPVERVTGYDTHIPLFRLEMKYLPSVERIVAAAKRTLDAS